MYGIGNKIQNTAHVAVAHITIYFISHNGRFLFVSGFAGFAHTIFKKRAVNTGSGTVFAQNLKPCKVVFVAVIVFHRKFSSDISQQENRRTVDTVMFQKIPVRDCFLHRDIFAGRSSIVVHEFSSGRTEHATCFMKSIQLKQQFAIFPPVICIKECDILSMSFLNTPVTGGCSSNIMWIFQIVKIRTILINGQYF